ncbi:MFS transporter [Streptomyces sp. 796.1]|uniref:MFS transporter n=1 Tax=Streptomyces sp. 796.1 TaxID=3163029 RepID=UPI0039C961C4
MKRGHALHRHLAGAVAARIGDEMSGPALMLAGFALTGSAADAASLLAALTSAAAVGGPLLGVLLDRADRPGRLLAGALLLYAAGLGATLLALGRSPLALTLLIAVVTGLLGPAVSGGWTAQVPRVVPDGDRLPRANALDAMTFSAASLAGPALAGGLAEVAGAPTAVGVAVLLIAAALPAAWLVPARPARARAAGPASVLGDLVAGVRVILARRALARATLTSTVSCTAQGVLLACIPLLGERAMGGAGRGALLLSCAAVAALAAGAVLARLPRAVAPDTVLWASALVQCAALTLASWGEPAPLVVAALVLGVGEGPQLAALFAVRHREAPEHLRSQIFTTGASLKITGFALGAAVGGPLATWSLSGTVALAAGVALLAAVAFFAVPPPTGEAPGGGAAPR